MSRIRVSVVVVHYRTPELTSACLQSVAGFGDDSCEILVVDNSPGPLGVDAWTARKTGALTLCSGGNVGFGRACNLAAAQARGEYLFLLNPDAQLLEPTPAVLSRFLDKHPDAGAVGCLLVDPDGRPYSSACRFPTPLGVLAGREVTGRLLRSLWPAVADAVSLSYPPAQLRAPRPVDWCFGAALMVRKSAFEAVGGFDPRIFLYCEEMDLCLNMANQGARTWFTPETRVMHRDAASSNDTHDAKRLAYIAAGHRYFYRKHHGAAGAVLFMAADLFGSLAKGLIWSLAAMCAPAAARAGRWRKALWHWRCLGNYFVLKY